MPTTQKVGALIRGRSWPHLQLELPSTELHALLAANLDDVQAVALPAHVVTLAGHHLATRLARLTGVSRLLLANPAHLRCYGEADGFVINVYGNSDSHASVGRIGREMDVL